MRRKTLEWLLCLTVCCSVASVAGSRIEGKGKQAGAGDGMDTETLSEGAAAADMESGGAGCQLYGGFTNAILADVDRIENYMASLERRNIQLTEESYLSVESRKKREEQRKKEEAERKKAEEKKKEEERRRKYKSYKLPEFSGYRGFKSYEPYRAITCRSTPQWKLQQVAETDRYGLRVVDKRYCVAIGSYFGTQIGQYFDLVLKNGTVIPCIKVDEKSDRHTDDTYHIYTVHSRCCSEFLVDVGTLRDYIGGTGDVSDLFRKWNSPVVEVRVYQINYFDS